MTLVVYAMLAEGHPHLSRCTNEPQQDNLSSLPADVGLHWLMEHCSAADAGARLGQRQVLGNAVLWPELQRGFMVAHFYHDVKLLGDMVQQDEAVCRQMPDAASMLETSQPHLDIPLAAESHLFIRGGWRNAANRIAQGWLNAQPWALALQVLGHEMGDTAADKAAATLQGLLHGTVVFVRIRNSASNRSCEYQRTANEAQLHYDNNMFIRLYLAMQPVCKDTLVGLMYYGSSALTARALQMQREVAPLENVHACSCPAAAVCLLPPTHARYSYAVVNLAWQRTLLLGLSGESSCSLSLRQAVVHPLLQPGWHESHATPPASIVQAAAELVNCLRNLTAADRQELKHLMLVPAAAEDKAGQEPDLAITCTCKGGIRGLVCSHQMRAVMAAANHSSAKAAQRFTGNEVVALINERCKVGDELKRSMRDDILRLIEAKTYRGKRHSLGLPVRGQKTSSNAQTARKLKRHQMYDVKMYDVEVICNARSTAEFASQLPLWALYDQCVVPLAYPALGLPTAAAMLAMTAAA
ncbi:hypothetical protein COO60DRAFT_1686135 [Scenedesmus sp. NREL 46B-D3]|nr:hypothetical protein COO60DRAFT_1686135 [Scenedesmus sp. NREL 46B-D3]